MSNPFQQVLYKEAELEEAKTQHPYHVGYSAHGQNKTRQHNPYKEGTEAAAQWAKGWEHASDGKPKVKMANEEVDTLKGTPVVSLSDLSPKDTKKDKYGRTVPKKLQKDDPRVKFANKDGKIKEEVDLEEAVEVSHDRYMRSHSKKASGNGMWMFTHKPMGSVDYKDEKEVHQARGSFSDAAKSAKQWAKSHGHSRVYVMESSEQKILSFIEHSVQNTKDAQD